MLKKMAWNAFKKTGSIDLFLELKEIESIEKKQAFENRKEEIAEELTNSDIKVKKDGINQNKGNDHC